MTWLIGSVGYLLIHGLLYFCLFRTMQPFTNERGVFLYHAVSGVAMTVAAVTCWLTGVVPGVTLAFAVGTTLLHGIYSISFLELWSLTEGGYSLQIMRAIGASEALGDGISRTELELIGRGKQVSRTDSLERFGWVSRSDGMLHLTPQGRLVATALSVLHSLVSIKRDR